MDASFRATDDPRDAIARFLHAVVKELETRPLPRRLLTHPDELAMVARRVGPDDLEAKQRGAMRLMGPFVERAQATGQMIDARPEVIVGVLRTVPILLLHRDELGPDLFPEVLDLIIRFVADGLTQSVALPDAAHA